MRERQWLVDRVRATTGRAAVLPVLADLLEITEVSACAKMKGKTPFRPEEIDKMRIAFRLTDEETVNGFIKNGGKGIW